MYRVDGEACFVLHIRPYRDTSALVNLFSPNYGRLTCVAKGLRGSGKSRQSWRAALQAFNLVAVSWQGRNELKTLLDVQDQVRYSLQGRALFCGMYINELLERLLHAHDPHPDIFVLYTQCLSRLGSGAELEESLRRFEFGLLEQLGYGFNFSHCNRSGQQLRPDKQYCFLVDEGLVLADDTVTARRFSGETLMQLAIGDFSGDALLTAKRLSRLALQGLLGDKPLRSRALFASTAPLR